MSYETQPKRCKESRESHWAWIRGGMNKYMYGLSYSKLSSEIT